MGQSINSTIDWSQVANDGGLGVMVLDAQGRVLSINPTAARTFSHRASRDAGNLRLTDVLPAPAANERLEFVKQVITSGEPLLVRDLWGGVALRCTYRRVDGPDPSGPVAIIVSCPENSAADDDEHAGIRVAEARHVDLGPLSGLTTSELKVMALIGEGLSNAEIAARLHRAVKTVESHRAALTDKTGSSSRVQLGIMARRAGLSRRVASAETTARVGA